MHAQAKLASKHVLERCHWYTQNIFIRKIIYYNTILFL